jgi:hypothetical protein
MKCTKNPSYIKIIDQFYRDDLSYRNNMKKLSRIFKGEGNISCKCLAKFFNDNSAFSQYADSYANESSKYSITIHPLPIIGKKITYRYCKHDSTQTIITTESQLLFIKWAIESGFYNWVALQHENNQSDEITDYMQTCNNNKYDELVDKIADTHNTKLDIFLYMKSEDNVKINLSV